MHGIVLETYMRVFFWPWTSASDSYVWIFKWVASLIQNSWSVLTVILFTSKEEESSLRAISHPVWMTSWLLSHIAWQLYFIHFSWASDQRQPIAMLQEAQAFFWNLFCTVLMATSSVPEQVRQPPEADFKWKWATFSLNSSWVDSSPQCSVLSSQSCSPVLPEETVSLLGASCGVLNGSLLPCGLLCPLLTLASVVLAWALFPGQLSGVPLGSNPTFCAGDQWWTWWVSTQLGGADKGNVWYGKKGKRWSPSLMCRAAWWRPGPVSPWTLEQWWLLGHLLFIGWW